MQGTTDPLTEELLKEWRRLKSATEEKVEFSIPRWYHSDGKEKARLVGFCDASTRAYSAVVYLRMGESDARIQFVTSKTRVCPTKALTIPRLELMSALLLAKLCHTVKEALQEVISLKETTCFTDSKVSLHWIQAVDGQWKQFVENRVVSIRKLVPSSQWRHCPGVYNPADIPSRGMLPQKLKKEETWLHGPEWLRVTLEPSTLKREEMPEECLREQKGSIHTLSTLQKQTVGVSQIMDVEKYSSLKKLLRTTAAVLKFTNLIKKREKTTVEVLREAKILWLREAQERLTTEKDFKNLHQQLRLKKGEDGLWRCFGRMKNDLEAKQPILIGRQHHLAKLLIREAHQRVKHNGCKETLTELRSHYWMPKGRQAVKKELHQCTVLRDQHSEVYPLPPCQPSGYNKTDPSPALALTMPGHSTSRQQKKRRSGSVCTRVVLPGQST